MTTYIPMEGVFSTTKDFYCYSICWIIKIPKKYQTRISAKEAHPSTLIKYRLTCVQSSRYKEFIRTLATTTCGNILPCG